MALRDVFLNETTGNIVRMLGFAEPIAKMFTEMNPRADFALAKSYTLWFTASYPGAKITKKDVDQFRYPFSIWRREIGIELVELLKTKPALEKKINVAKSHEEVLEILSAAAPEEDVITMLDLGEGWKWVELTNKHHSKEARTMQHCATDGRGELVSLRDPSGNPHVTMTYNKSQNTVYQMKGKQNVAPVKDYWDAILQFFKTTQAEIKDPFVKSKALELYNQIKTLTGKELNVSKDEVYKKLFEAISSDAAKQWVWDTQPYTFDNPDVDYDEAREIEAALDKLFKKAGYSTIAVEPASGETDVFYFSSNWKNISEDALDRIEEVPPYQEVEHTWQGITVYRMAEAGIVNPTTARSLKDFGNQHNAELTAVYSMLSELFGGYEYDLNAAVNSDTDNNVDPVEYEDFTGYEGSSGVGTEVIEKAKFNNRWDKWWSANLFGPNTTARFGRNYYENPEYKKLSQKMTDMRQAGEEPPENLK